MCKNLAAIRPLASLTSSSANAAALGRVNNTAAQSMVLSANAAVLVGWEGGPLVSKCCYLLFSSKFKGVESGRVSVEGSCPQVDSAIFHQEQTCKFFFAGFSLAI